MQGTAAAVAAVALLGVAGAGLAAGSLQQDYAAYFTAGEARRRGLDPYVNHVGARAAPALWDGSPFRHSRFLYPPLAAELCRPLAWIPFRVGKLVFTAGALAALVAAALGTGARWADARWVLVGAAVFFPVYLHLDRGQIDLYLLPLLLGAWRLRRHALAAGALLAVAASFKPALLGVVPVLAALERPRFAAATLVGVAALLGISAAVTGPGLVAEYARAVLPRAAVYGEGGTEAMLLDGRAEAPERLGLIRGDDDRVFIEGRGYEPSLLERWIPWPVQTSASLPRLLAPESPSWATALLPYAVAVVGLGWAARGFVRRRRLAANGDSAGPAAEALLYLGSVVACVVASPAGWAMGLVWGLPSIVPAVFLRRAGGLPNRHAYALGAAGLACALPVPIGGWPALAGTALVAALAAASLSVAARSAT